MTDNKNLLIIGFIIIVGFFFVLNQTRTDIFSTFTPEELESRKLIEIESSSHLFDPSKVVGGKVTFTSPKCTLSGTESSVRINNLKVASQGIPMCENIVADFDELSSSAKATILKQKETITRTFEIDPSFLVLGINVIGADSITWFMKVDCTNNNHCFFEERRTEFVCDLSDFKCKNPQLIEREEQKTDLIVSEADISGEDKEGNAFLFGILLVSLIALVVYLVVFKK